MALVEQIANMAAMVREKFNSLTPRVLPSGGSAGQVLTKASAADYAATWQTPSGGGGGSSDPLDLAMTDVAAPAANTIRLYREEIAGKSMLAVRGSSGVGYPVQASMAHKPIATWNPPGNATTVPGVNGMPAMTVTGFTATARTIAATNRLTRTRRIGYVTAATAGAVGQFRANAAQYTIGDASGLGGFTFSIRFAITDTAPVSDARMFVGMKTSTTPTNVDPFTLTNCIGIAQVGGSNSLFLICCGASIVGASQTLLPAAFDASDTTALYELTIHSPRFESKVYWSVTRLDTGDVASDEIAGDAGTDFPGTTTLLCAPWCYRTNNTTALAVAMDFAPVYIETDI